MAKDFKIVEPEVVTKAKQSAAPWDGNDKLIGGALTNG